MSARAGMICLIAGSLTFVGGCSKESTSEAVATSAPTAGVATSGAPSTAALPRLLDELATAGIEVRQLNFGQPDLEQVFMRLTQRSLRD